MPIKTCPFIFLLFILSIHIGLQAQNELGLSIKNTTYVSSGDSLPFWLWANQNGAVIPESQFLNLTDLALIKKQTPLAHTNWQYSCGAEAFAGLSDSSYLQLNQAFASISWKKWKLEAGLFQDEQQYDGLSTTNGNIARSLNARPYPKIRFSTDGYKPVPFLKKWVSFKAEYDEGLLNDDRYVENTKLHHKSFYFQVIPTSKWNIQLGLEHFVMWGGKSKNASIGQMPEDFKSYLIYISGSRGDDDFPQTDQANVAGNQLGTYQAQIQYDFEPVTVSFYLSHPFEDLSGVNWRNWPDNVYGLHFKLKRNKFVNKVVYEFTNTRKQSLQGDYWYWNETQQKWLGQEVDNYFTHGVYCTGYSYHKMMMSSPLFLPVFSTNNIMGIPSNRFYTHHIGAIGNFAKGFGWKGLVTYTHYFGTYAAPYDPVVKKVSALLSISYSNIKMPFNIEVSTAADFSNTQPTDVGVQLQISRSW